MDAALSGFNLGTVLLLSCGFLVVATFLFGTMGGRRKIKAEMAFANNAGFEISINEF